MRLCKQLSIALTEAVSEPPSLAQQDGASTNSLKEALARAEAAEARAKLLEQQADNLGRQVALLEVRSYAWGILE